MDNSEEIRVVYTCGLCEEICEVIDSHACIEGYTSLWINDNNYFYPLLDDGESYLRRGKEGIEMVRINNKNSHPNIAGPSTVSVPVASNCKIKLTDRESEILILAVQQRQPLWDFSSNVEGRSREITHRLWDEVSTELNGKLSAKDAQTKFKNLRDTYRKIIQGEQHASGSVRTDSKEKWKFYDIMEFLRDSCLIRPTASNIPASTSGNVGNETQSTESTDDGDVAISPNFMITNIFY